MSFEASPNTRPPSKARRREIPIRDTVVLRLVTRPLVPFILLFALYVQFHGDYGPGGGFQAGVIFASGLLLYAMVFGADALRRVCPPQVAQTGTALGVLIYGGVGVATLFAGGNFLDYGSLDPADPTHGQHLGILLVELGVGLTVTSVMLTIYYQFSSRPTLPGRGTRRQ